MRFAQASDAIPGRWNRGLTQVSTLMEGCGRGVPEVSRVLGGVDRINLSGAQVRMSRALAWWHTATASREKGQRAGNYHWSVRSFRDECMITRFLWIAVAIGSMVLGLQGNAAAEADPGPCPINNKVCGQALAYQLCAEQAVEYANSTGNGGITPGTCG